MDPYKPVQGNTEERKLEELKREFRYWWGTLSRDEILELAHKRDELLTLLNEKYGYSRHEAAQEIDKALADLEPNVHAGDKPRSG